MSSESGPVVQAEQVVKRFGDLTAVDGISLDVQAGECFGLLGPNGAGKTTTVRMIQAASPITAGRIRVLGHDVAVEPRRVKAALGVCPQQDNLDEDFSVLRNLLVYARYFGIPRTEARRRAMELLEFLQLQDRAGTGVRELSGGMKRRLVIARALLNDPRLLLLDEPTTGLDPQVRHSIWQRVRALSRSGTTILLTTHYMEEAAALCDRLVIMDRGRIVAQGAPEALVREHVARDVIEVADGSEALPDFAAARGWVTEAVPDRLLIYSARGDEDYRALREGFPAARVLLRRATLEDVFLKLTGRDLRE